MSSRRAFIKQTAAACLIASVSTEASRAAESKAARHSSITLRRGTRIKSVVRRDETTLRLGGNGDNWHMSWARNDRQYVSLCDGYGWFEDPKGLLNSRLLAIDGGPHAATFSDVPGYPAMPSSSTDSVPRYYNFGTLAIDRQIYQYLGTWNRQGNESDGKIWTDLRFNGAKLIYSPNNGRTWCNQDGSTPVVWDDWQQRSRQSLVFFEEPQDAFSLLTILQMGRNYEANCDGYIYVYSPNGNTDGTMNELVMFRVPKAQILDRSAYEYFAGIQPSGTANWIRDINACRPVHSFPRGWVNSAAVPYSWQPSVAYNAALGLYMMANWGTGSAPDGQWFGKPSYLGIYTASNPWGPWTQIHEEMAWTPGNDRAARAYQPQIAPKWIAPDGKSFWLVWSDYQNRCDEREELRIEAAAKRITEPDGAKRFRLQEMRRCMPYYAFNTQRVDLILS